MNKDIFLLNSLGNKKEKFEPINKNKIGMYVCGPTVYDDRKLVTQDRSLFLIFYLEF